MAHHLWLPALALLPLLSVPALAEDIAEVQPVQRIQVRDFESERQISLTVGLDPTQVATYDAASGTTYLWDLTTGKELKHWSQDPEAFNVTCAALSPAEPLIAIAGTLPDNTGAIDLYDTITDEYVAGIPTPGDVFALAFSPDGAMLAIGSGEGFVTLVDLTSEKPQQPDWIPLVLKDTGVTTEVRLVFAPDGHAVLASAVCAKAQPEGGEFDLTTTWRTIDASTHAATDAQRLNGDAITDLDWHPDSKLVTITTRKQPPLVWTLEGQLLGPLIGGQDEDPSLPYCVAMSSDERYMAAAFRASVALYDIRPPGGMVADLSGYEADVMDLAITPDNQRLLVVTLAGELLVWELGKL